MAGVPLSSSRTGNTETRHLTPAGRSSHVRSRVPIRKPDFDFSTDSGERDVPSTLRVAARHTYRRSFLENWPLDVALLEKRVQPEPSSSSAPLSSAPPKRCVRDITHFGQGLSDHRGENLRIAFPRGDGSALCVPRRDRADFDQGAAQDRRLPGRHRRDDGAAGAMRKGRSRCLRGARSRSRGGEGCPRGSLRSFACMRVARVSLSGDRTSHEQLRWMTALIPSGDVSSRRDAGR